MPKPKGKSEGKAEKPTRIAIVNPDKCQPKKCKQECKKNCPVVRIGKVCIEVTPKDKIATISETLCIGCGICVKKCPFDAIKIVNLPSNLEKETSHRFGQNSFKLNRLPSPRPGKVVGIVGTNGIGKSTGLKILGGQVKPNLGKYNNPPDWDEILVHFRGSELQNYFTQYLDNGLKAVRKPQYVDQIPKKLHGNVRDILKNYSVEIVDRFDLGKLLDRDIEALSGGELQRFACAYACVQEADVLMFDEISSYLDIKQRINAARAIRSMLTPDKYIVVVEHDLSVLDYLSDLICVLYGVPTAYGVVTKPISVREGINVFLDGYIPSENLRFRTESLSMKVTDNAEDVKAKRTATYKYPKMSKSVGPFKLDIDEGDFTDSEIVVLLGENGTGKTTFIRMLAGKLQPDGDPTDIPLLHVSYKPQKISPTFDGTVRKLLHAKIRDFYVHPQFAADVIKPLRIDELFDNEVQTLSGGELQRVAIALCLGTPADVYLLDEPSAYLDSEQRMITAKVIKRYIYHTKKTGFVVEHDFIMATYLADKVIVFEGQPSIHGVANTPQDLVSGMNKFLEILGVTFRRDPTHFRPRINKPDSAKDSEQKQLGQYFYIIGD